MNVSAATLLKGAWYSVEQAGHLLHHAAILHRAKAYPTAAAVALFGREHVGAYRFLHEEWKKVVETGVQPNAEAIRRAVQDHRHKQQHAVLGITLTAKSGERLDTLIRTKMHSHPWSEEHKKAQKELDEVVRRKVKRAPDERHLMRLRALYVDLADSGTDWNRPAALSPAEATRYLLDAVNDYAGVHDRLLAEMLRLDDPALAAALDAWPDKPPLPDPDFDFDLFAR